MNREIGTLELAIESWLDVPPAAEDPDVVLDRVLAALDTTRQRPRSWLAWRPNGLDVRVALITGGVALVIVALPWLSGSSIWSADASPLPTQRQSPFPSRPQASSPPATIPRIVPFVASLTPGERYATSFDRPHVTFAVAAPGWFGDQGVRIYKDGSEVDSPTIAIFYYAVETPDNVYVDPCDRLLGPRPASSARDLAMATALIEGIEIVDGPTSMMVGGHPAWSIDVAIPDRIDCNPNDFVLWHVPGERPGGPTAQPGGGAKAWFVDVDDGVISFLATRGVATSESVIAEIDRIVATIEFE